MVERGVRLSVIHGVATSLEDPFFGGGSCTSNFLYPVCSRMLQKGPFEKMCQLCFLLPSAWHPLVLSLALFVIARTLASI